MKYSKTDLLALRAISLGGGDVRSVAEGCGISVPQTYKILKKLRGGRLVRLEEGRVTMAAQTMAALLADVLVKSPGAAAALSNSGLAVLAALDGGAVKKIQGKIGMSQQTVSRKLGEFMELGMVVKNDGYGIDAEAWPELVALASEYRLFMKYSNPGLPPGSVVHGICDGVTVFSNASDLEHRKTAFSRYPEYGIDFRAPTNYYCVGGSPPDATEVLRHSVAVCGEGGRLLKTMAAVFYFKVRDSVDLARVPEPLARVLSGETVDGWPPLGEIKSAVERFGFRE